MKRIILKIIEKSRLIWKARRLVRSLTNAYQFFDTDTPKNYVGYFKCTCGEFICRRQDWFSIREIFLKKEYAAILNYLAGIKKEPVIVDLGSNIGGFALYVYSHIPTARILSVEPAEDTFKILEKNRELNRSLPWEVKHAAVWNENGFVTLDRREASTGNRVTNDANGIEKTPAYRLNKIVDDRNITTIDLLKVDIEGAELEVLPDSENVLRSVAVMIIEVHTDRIDPKPVYDVMGRVFTHFWLVNGRNSKKPVIVSAREELHLPDAIPVDLKDMA